MTVFVDMDGVLADFDRHYKNTFGVKPEKAKDNVDWAAVRAIPNWYLNMPPMADAWHLWDYLVLRTKPVVLTGVPRLFSEQASANKRAWVEKYLGDDAEVITCRSRDKCHYAHQGDILIDDWDKYAGLWLGEGGIFIHHKNAVESVSLIEAWLWREHLR